MRALVYCGLAITMALVACNQTVGECYPRGQGDGTIGAGAGVITSTGVGASGEAPAEQTQDFKYPEDQCNAPDDDADALDTWINCKGLNAVDCMIKCGKAGAACTPAEKHPYKAEAGYGDLYMCKNGTPTSTCSYYYKSNGDECVFFRLGPVRAPLCVYVGGKP